MQAWGGENLLGKSISPWEQAWGGKLGAPQTLQQPAALDSTAKHSCFASPSSAEFKGSAQTMPTWKKKSSPGQVGLEEEGVLVSPGARGHCWGWAQLLASCIGCSRRKDVSEHNDLFLLGIFASCHQDACAAAEERAGGLRPRAPRETAKARYEGNPPAIC